MLGAMFRLFWNSSKRVNPCKASRIIRMLHHSPTRSRLRAMGQAILPKLLRCIENMYPSHYRDASDMPTAGRKCRHFDAPLDRCRGFDTVRLENVDKGHDRI